MSYSLGQVTSPLQAAASQIASRTISPAPKTSIVQQAVEKTAPAAMLASVQIQTPSYCGTVGPMLEGIQFPVAGAQLAPGALYVAVWPFLKKLSPTQAQQVAQAFSEAMDPVASSYPVQTTTPCELTFRQADACLCRDRKNPARHRHHIPDAISNSFSVQSCMSKEKTVAARHWISLFHNLYGWTELPFGYREINGEPVFIWTIELNPDPKKEFYDSSGGTHGDIKSGRRPSLPLVQVRNYAQAKLKAAVGALGLKATDVSPGIVLQVDRFDHAALATEAENAKRMLLQADAAPSLKSAPATERTLSWDSVSYRHAVRSPGDKKAAAYKALVDQAIAQAAAYARESTTAVWQTVGSLLVGGLISRTTDQQLRGVHATGFRLTQTYSTAAGLIANAEALSVATEAQARGLLTAPDPSAAYELLKRMREEVQGAINTVNTAVASVGAAPAQVGAVYQAAADSGKTIQQGLRDAIAKLDAKAGAWAAPLKQRWTCLLYTKAKNEQKQWPLRLTGLGDDLKSSVAAFAAVSPQAPTAVARYQKVLEVIAYVESQLRLSWWQKDYGPLPGWAWGAIGATGFLGGAFYLRKKRRAKAPTPNRRRLARRTSRRT